MFHKPRLITFTGANDHIDLDEMDALSSIYPIEWGILVSPTLTGHHPRYPSFEWIYKVLIGRGLAVSLHVCGDWARQIAQGECPEFPGRIPLAQLHRLQINVASTEMVNLAAVATFSRRQIVRCILQTRGAQFPTDDRVDWLFDRSGGRGLEPDFLPPYPENHTARVSYAKIGYAGNIGADNVLDRLSQINAPNANYWICMESKVCPDDRFSLAECEKICELIW